MAAEPSAKLDYRSRCLVGQIVEHVKSQGIFDQFRRDCIDELEQRESYRQLKQRVESHVATFLSKQTWTDALPKNQVRDSLRRHINQSEVLERGVKQLISQALESKAKSFQTRIEGVVQNYIYTQHHQQNQDKQNRRHKASDEKADASAKPSTSEAKQNVVNDITRLIPVPRPGEIGTKIDGHTSFKGKAVVQEVLKSGMSSKSTQQPKRTTHGLPTAPTGREGRNVGSPLFVDKDNVSPSEVVRVQDEKSRLSRIPIGNVAPSETSNGSEHRVKPLDEVNLKMESEETSSSKSNEKQGSRKTPECNETTSSFLNGKSADKVESEKNVEGLWVAHTVPIKEAADVPITVIKSEFKTATEEINNPPIHIDKFVKTTGDEEINKAAVHQDDPVAENNNVNMADEKLGETVEERIEESAVQSSSEMTMDELHAETSVVTMDSSGPVCSTQAQTVVRAEGQSLSPVCEEHASDELSVFVSTKEDWERVSSSDGGDSDISEVSSVHTSDLSSFNEEVSSSSGSYDDENIDEHKGEEATSNKNKNVETDETPAQSQQHPDAPTRRRSTRISSRRSTKEEEEEEDGRGIDGQIKEKNRDSARRKRRGRRRRRESAPRMSEGQSESSPVIKRRRGRPRKNERRMISSSSENQRRHSRWHSHGESSSAATERSSGHNKESSRRKRSQRQIKRTRCYSPSSEGTREVFLPCKRSRVGSKD